MNPTLPSDVSLYELAIQSESAPPALQVSPATFKSLCDSLISLLVEQEIPAVIWAKLPRGEAWWAGIEQYIHLPGVARSAYLFTHQREEVDEAPSHSGTQIDMDVPRDTPTNASTPVVTLQFPTESSLRREYFLLIWSARFKAGLFAHRPRSIHAHRVAEPSPLAYDLLSSHYGQPAQVLESPQERRQLLLAVCVLDGGVVAQALTGLEQAIAAHPLQLTGQSASAIPLLPTNLITGLTQQWQALMQDCPSTSSSPDLVEQLFSKQVQHQEELWQRNALLRKQAEQIEHLRLQNEELTTTLRLKDDFLNNVGQQLRTPLTTIKTALSLLGSPNIRPPQRQRYMDLIAKECDRQNTLITSLLDLTHLTLEGEQTELPPVRLVDVIPSVVNTYQPIADEKGVKVAFTVPDDLPAVACMTNWLKQIVVNLLQNAIKYTPSGGNVWIRARQQDHQVQLEVRDSGIGIAASEIPKIFDRFYRVRQSSDDASGVGLGLTIVQQLLLHCGGSISVRSKVDEGSTFEVLLPIYKSHHDPS